MILEKQIPRVRGIDKKKFFDEYVLSNTPVVIEDFVSHWPALEKWNADYFDQKIGNVEVELKKSISHKHPDIASNNPGETIRQKFSDYLKKTVYSDDSVERVKYYASGDENTFFREGQHNQNLSCLQNDFSLPALFNDEKLKQISFWISVKGLFSWLHFDGNCHHNLNVQVAGEKRVMLFSPYHVDQLYPFTLRETPQGFNFSKVDLCAVDEMVFPKFLEVPYQETILKKGDMLFIPCAWYHGIEHLGEVNINVNFWWEPDLYDLNPVVKRTKMFQSMDEAYLLKKIMAEENPKFYHWCQKEPEVAEFVFQCDEYFVNQGNQN